ncbi:hypothetical protein J2S11_002727 [Bacillus horti]|uniref:Uncharacterized protein n=1 Tax=Caldalkalibacillus horti TaxID=77523 RepID=A0ABT9W0S7_9BACI|nr:hypothetical protein [Bacillus horti]
MNLLSSALLLGLLFTPISSAIVDPGGGGSPPKPPTEPIRIERVS